MRTPKAYKVCDALTEGFLYFQILWGPWALGTTNNWTTFAMSLAGHALGVLLIFKWSIRWKTGYRPPRWGEEDARRRPAGFKWGLWMTRLMAALTVLVMGYALAGVLNARAEFHTEDLKFDYFETYLSWLPHSYAQSRSFFWVHTHLALAWTFWALRDWLLGKTSRERALDRDKDGDERGLESRGPRHRSFESDAPAFRMIPDRLRRFLWVICLNAGVLAMESILQRLSGTNKLLWLKEPSMNNTNFSQFGPYAYRSNGAQYFNLVWPLCVGFWLFLAYEFRQKLRHRRRFGSESHFVLIPLAVLLIACPFISSARGGSVVAILMLCFTCLVFWRVTRRYSFFQKLGAIGFFAAAMGTGMYLGWEKLAPRLEDMLWGDTSGREEIYETSEKIARDFVWLGTGANSFAPVYRLYKPMDDIWHAYLHDDWLEIRVNFGRVGMGLILLLLLATFLSHAGKGRIRAPGRFPILLYLAIAGVLFHAKFDFPFRIYSLTHMTVVLCCLLHVTTTSRFGKSS